MKNILKISLLIISCMIALLAPIHAQDVYMGKFNKTSVKDVFFKPVGRVDALIYTFRATNNDYFLDAYNDSMEMIASVALDFFPKKVEHVDFINYSDKILVLYNVEEKGSLILYGAILDKDGILTKNPQKLISEKISWLGGKDSYFNVIYSQDRSKLVIMSMNDKRNTFKTIVYADDLSRISSYDVDVKDKKQLGEKVPYDQIKVSNSGTVIIPTFNTRSNGAIDYVSFLMIDVIQKQANTVVVTNDKYYLNDFVYTLDNHKQMVHMAGIYKTSRGGNAEGILKTEINMIGATITRNDLLPFPEKYLSALKRKNSQKAMNDFKTNHIVIKQDGSFILVTEYLNITESTYSTGFYHNYSMRTVRRYHYGDIAVLNYSGDGVLLWSEFIRKEQNSRHEEGLLSSFAFLNTGASLVFMYYDEGKSAEVVNIAAIDEYGKLQSTRLNIGDNGHEWLMKYGAPIDKQSLLIPVINDRNLSFAKIRF